MSFIKNIFGRIWAFWGLITFVATFLIILGPSMLSHFYKNYNKGQAFFLKVSRVWISTWLFLVGCRLKVVGRNNFEQNKNYVIVFNHNALLDVPLSAPFVYSANKTIGKDSFAKVPLFSWFYKRGAVLINRKDERSRVKSFDAMKQVLQMGMHMCIYPEGTRNRTDRPIKDFYDGAFKLAIDSKKDIMPCVITGTKKAMPIHKTFYLLPTKLQMIFLPPVSSDNIDAKTLSQQVHSIMTEVYIKSN
jgi:1-acyl-sn-glycerol-3-phosphate acyltransferase